MQDLSAQSRLALKMMDYYAGDARRINHFVKVHGFARFIGLQEGLNEHEQDILEAAALVHDIGIKISLEKYDSSAGHYQELEGPPIAMDMLSLLGYPDFMVERIGYLVGHHHTYGHIEGNDYQILVEADFLVNVIEHNMSDEQIASIRDRIFRTTAGRAMLDCLTNHDEMPAGMPV